MTTNLKINKSLKATVGTQAEAETNIKSALENLNSDIKKTEKTQTVLTLSVLDYALLSSASSVDNASVSKENISIYRGVIKENAEASFPNDDATVKKIINQSSVPIMSAMLCMAENTGFSVGYVLGESKAHRTFKDAHTVKKEGGEEIATLKSGYTKEIFYSPIKIFPKKFVAGQPKKDEITEDNSSVLVPVTQEIIRVAYKIFFEGKALNHLKTDIAKTERGVGGQTHDIPENEKDFIHGLNLLVSAVDEGLFETMQPEDESKKDAYNTFKTQILEKLEWIKKGFAEAEAMTETEENMEAIERAKKVA